MRTVLALMVMPRSRSISIASSTCSFMSRSATVPSLDQPVGQGGFAVVDMGDDGEIADLNDTDRLYQRFPGVEGSAYFVAGLGVNYQRADGITLAPIRSGVGLRAGANVGYLAYSRQRNWIPF
jgi:hypothetical protein